MNVDLRFCKVLYQNTCMNVMCDGIDRLIKLEQFDFVIHKYTTTYFLKNGFSLCSFYV